MKLLTFTAVNSEKNKKLQVAVNPDYVIALMPALEDDSDFQTTIMLTDGKFVNVTESINDVHTKLTIGG